MRRKEKKGQMQIGFGMIFSIIIIIATLAVAGYIIVKFLNIGTDVSCGLYFNDLQEEIDKAYFAQGEVQDIYNEKLPNGVSSVCFGNSSQQLIDRNDQEKFDEFKFYSKPGNNMFFWPREVCDNREFSYGLEHINTDGFFCISASGGKANIKLIKGSFDPLVKLTK